MNKFDKWSFNLRSISLIGLKIRSLGHFIFYINFVLIKLYSKVSDSLCISYLIVRLTTAQELVSHDIHNNTFNYKHTFSVEIVPICKDNVVCLPVKLAQHLGNMGQICIVYRVTQAIHVIDPNTCQSKSCDVIEIQYTFIT
jgi:hypothetical protein